MYDYLEQKSEEFEAAKTGKKPSRASKAPQKDVPEPIKTLTPSQFKNAIQKRA